MKTEVQYISHKFESPCFYFSGDPAILEPNYTQKLTFLWCKTSLVRDIETKVAFQNCADYVIARGKTMLHMQVMLTNYIKVLSSFKQWQPYLTMLNKMEECIFSEIFATLHMDAAEQETAWEELPWESDDENCRKGRIL